MDELAERLERPRVAAMDALLGTSFPVLDQGFVRVVDYMGDDAAVVQAARVSYGKGTKHVSEDRSLIRYLMRNWHTTPFEMPNVRLHVRVPMDAWRQWIRTRMASVNEYSTRYSEAIDACQTTDPYQWRAQAAGNKQGSAAFLDSGIGEELTHKEAFLQHVSRTVYKERLANGVAREQARKDLPLSTYTEAYWHIDLHNLLHFLQLRMDAHAQLEIRSYANLIGTKIVAQWCPLVWEAFVDYRLEAISLSRMETILVSLIATRQAAAALNAAQELGLYEHGQGGKVEAQPEADELDAKLTRLGLEPPWRAGKPA